MIARLLRRWLRPAKNGWVNIRDVDPSLETEWRIKWKGVDQFLIFDGTSPGVAAVIVEMHKSFQELPEEVWVALGPDKMTRVM